MAGKSDDSDDHVLSDKDQVTNNEASDEDHVTNNVVSSEDHVTNDEVSNQDHMTSNEISYEDHVTNNGDHMDIHDECCMVSQNGASNEDTEGEGGDTLPQESTTDACTDPLDPIDFIETHPHFTGALGVGRGKSEGIPFENWSILAQGKPAAKRVKPSRPLKSERPRPPYVPPRVGKIKCQHPRPSPSSRKRRLSGRLVRPAQIPHVSEEGDMAQADEMGEGEGRDDGFVEGLDTIARRRNKKRPGGIHMLVPPTGGGSPPSSPSNTPISRRKVLPRKSRPKPRPRKNSKPQLASADVSTQESTTQGPGSSESSDNSDDGGGGGAAFRTEDVLESEEDEYEESRSLTPNPKDPASISNNPHGNAPFDNEVLDTLYLPPHCLDHVSDIHNTPSSPVRLGLISNEILHSNSGDNQVLDSNETSDTDYHALNPHSPLKDARWANRRLESDLSTAPFSSETSDMDTSGNERVFCRGNASAAGQNGGIVIAPLSQTKTKSDGVGGARGGKKGSGFNKVHSGSSGDEFLSRKKHMKKPIPNHSIPQKPPPPLMTKKPLGGGPGMRPQLNSSSVPPKKPLHSSKSNPLLSRVVHPPNSTGPSSSGVSTRNSSVKPSLSSRPRPPLTSKTKPPPPPKTPLKGGAPGVGGATRGVGSGQVNKPPPKPFANHLSRSTSAMNQSSVVKQRAFTEKKVMSTDGSASHRESVLKKAHSVEKTDAPQKPKTVRRNTSKESIQAREKGEGPDRRSQSTPSPPVLSSKPSIPTKPKRQEKKALPVVTKPLPPPPAAAPKSLLPSSSVISDSSKNPSSSEVTTSGHSQSPTISLSPSPPFRKKPLQPHEKGSSSKKRALITSSSKTSLTTSKTSKTPLGTKGAPDSVLVKVKGGAPIIKPSAVAPGGKSTCKDSVLSSISEMSLSDRVGSSTPTPISSQHIEVGVDSPTPPPVTSRHIIDGDDEVGIDSPTPPPVPPRHIIDGDNEVGADSPVPSRDIIDGDYEFGDSSPTPPPVPSRHIINEELNGISSSPPPSLLARNVDSTIHEPLTTNAQRRAAQISSSETKSLSSSRTKGGPRRPPPCPPTSSSVAAPTSPSSSSVGQPTSNIPTGGGGNRDHHANPPSSRSNPPRGYSRNQYEDVDLGEHESKYFKPHLNRDLVEDVSYVTVKRHPTPPDQGGAQQQRPYTPPQQSAQDSGDSARTSSGKGSDSEKESKHFSHTRRFTSNRRAPPKPPVSDSGTTKHLYSTVDKNGKVLPTDKGHDLLATKASTSNGIYECIDETRDKVLARKNKPLTSRKSMSPPPTHRDDVAPSLPDRPAPKKKTQPPSLNPSSPNLLEPPNGYSGMVLVGPPEDSSLHHPLISKTRDPIYDIIPDNASTVSKKMIRARRNYEEIILPEFEGEAPQLWVNPKKLDKEKAGEKSETEKVSDQEQEQTESTSLVPLPIEIKKEIAVIVSPKLDTVVSRLSANGNVATLSIEDLRENWVDGFPLPLSVPMVTSRKARSFSTKRRDTLMYKRASSGRFNKLKSSTLSAASTREKSLVRSCSLDKLNDRMDQSVRNSIHHSGGSSSEDEDERAVASPTESVKSCLPEIPRSTHHYRVPKSIKNHRPAGPYLVPPDVEPLYQYINTAEFLREPEEGWATKSRAPLSDSWVEEGGKQNQLDLARQLSMRSLWCEQPEIIQSGLLDKLSSEERNLQEAIFEVISSEATYLRSLDLLIQHFMDDPGMNPHLPEGRRVLDKRQHHVIFSNVKEVREVSAQFLGRLQKRQRESAVVKNITDIILEFAENHLECYVSYCTNQVYQIREMQDLGNVVMFREYVRRLESDKSCQNLNLQSFLLLPMQRITRLPLLILAILNRTPLDHPDHDLVEKTLRSVQKLVTLCNDGARQMDRTEQLHEIHKKLDFGKLKPFPLVSVSRQLERRGTLIRLQVEQKLLGKQRIKKKPLFVFVFTDYIIVTKRKKDPKGDYIYRVKQYASRAVVEVDSVDTYHGMAFPKFGEQNGIAKATYAVSNANAGHAFLVLFLGNINQKEGSYIFLAQNDTDKTRWLECLKRPDQKDEERIYQRWDCPQVQAVYDYHAEQPDELGLERGDVVKVYRKMADGWYEGERLRDMQCGWFPSNFTSEIENAHTRARNLRQTHKLNSPASKLVLQN